VADGHPNGPKLVLRRQRCLGDDSGVCCEMQASGQLAIVRGRLFPSGKDEGGRYIGPETGKYAVDDTDVCLVPPVADASRESGVH
jgi:hypothetical protein